MTRNTLLRTFFALSITAGANAATIDSYNNTTNDSGANLAFASGYDGIGDSITLTQSGLPLDDALVQLYDNDISDASGTFDATLTFYDPTSGGSPVQIGSSYTVIGTSINTMSEANVDFSLGGISLPDDVAFVVTLANVVDASLGVELYNGPPSPGSNTPDTAIVLQGGTFSTLDMASGAGNAFLELSSETPEPGSWLLVGLGLMLAFTKVIKPKLAKRRKHDS